MDDRQLIRSVLRAARMAVTQGLGEGRPAHGFFLVVGDATEIFANELLDRDTPDITHCRYGNFKTYLDRRRDGLSICDCLYERKENFLNLLCADGGIVIDYQKGQVCCGGFFVHDLTSGIRDGGARTMAASAMATQAGGCYVVFASEEICGSVVKPVPASAMLKVFNRTKQPDLVPVHISEVAREISLKHWLRPLKFSADLYRYNEDFVDGTRQWILDEIEGWRRNLNGSRCKILLAGPGFGKTAIAARLHQKMPQVLAIHLCRHNDSFKRDPRRMITSIVSQIVDKVPSFENALREVYEAEGRTTDAYSLRPTARALADRLLLNPLTEIEPPQDYNIGGRYVIIIDALDEAEHDTKNDLLDLVAFDLHKLPRWVAVLVTARSEADINTALKPLSPTVLDAAAHEDRCRNDVRFYLRRILAPVIADEGSLITAIDKAAARSEGLFLYLHHIRPMVGSCDDVDALPNGLANLYKKEFERVLGPDGLGNKNNERRRVVEAIIAAQVPAIHVRNELPGLSGVSHAVALKVVNKLSRLLPVHDSRVHIFHSSFAAWLTGSDGFDRSSDGPLFFVQRRAAHRRLASACSVQLIRLLGEKMGCRLDSDRKAVNDLKRFLETPGCRISSSHKSTTLEAYALRWSVTHLVEAGEAGGFRHVGLSLLYSIRFLVKRAPLIDTLIDDALLLNATLLHRALILARNHCDHLRSVCADWLAEELWQRLLRPATARGDIGLKRLANDAQMMARANLRFSARHAYLTPADSYLHCVLKGHKSTINAVTSFDANGHTWVASCSQDKTVRIWNPMKGGSAIHRLEGHAREVTGLTAFDANGRKWLASFSHISVHIWDPIMGELIRVLRGHSRRVNGVATCVDTDGHTWLASCSDDRSVRIWNAMEDGEAFRVLEGHHGHRLRVLGVVFVRTGGKTLIASCSVDKTVRVWDAINDCRAVRVRKLLGHSQCVNGVTAFICANGVTRVASCSDDMTVRIWDPMTGIELRRLEGHLSWVKGVTAFVEPGYAWVVASCSSDETVRIWGTTDRGTEKRRVLNGHSKSVTSVTTFLGDSRRWIASCSNDHTVRIWDAINLGGANHVLEGHFDVVNGLTAFKDANNNAWVASCSVDKTVRIWDSIYGSQVVRDGHSGKVNAVTAFLDASGHMWVASCSDDKTVRIWEAINGSHKVVLGEHSDKVHGVTAFMDADGRTWLATCSEKTILLWDTNNFGQAQRRRDYHDYHLARVNGLTAIRDVNGNMQLASFSVDRTIGIWDVLQDHVCKLEGHSDCVNGVTAFVGANGNTWVASCSKDNTVRVWDTFEGGKLVHELSGHSAGVNGVAAFFDSRSTWVASGSDDTTICIWDAIGGGNAKNVLQGHSAPIIGVTCIDAPGSSMWVASCSKDSTVRIWDAINGGGAFFVIPLDSPPTAISTVSAAPAHTRDERAAASLLVIGHENGQVTFWEDMQGESTQASCCFV